MMEGGTVPVQLIKWTGLALEYTGKYLAQSDLDDALQALVREGLDRWFKEQNGIGDDADTKLRNREQIEALVSHTKSAAFRLAIADVVSSVAPVLASMLARRTRPEQVSFVPNRIVLSAIKKYFSERLSRSLELTPLREKGSDGLFYRLMSADSLLALRNAAQGLPVRAGWFTFRRKWGYHLGHTGDRCVFLLGYDNTFEWDPTNGMFFTFQRQGGVQQVEQ